MICLICKKNFKDITNTHLKLHNLNRAEYRKLDKEFDTFLKIRMSEIAKGKKDVKKGRTYTEVFGEKKAKEISKKISASSIGKKRLPFSKTHKLRISNSKKGKPNNSPTKFKKGDLRLIGNKFAYINGTTSEAMKVRNSIEMRLWRESVFARDNYTCQKTGIKGGKLHSHHIQNFAQFPELRFAINNGITLSEESHRNFHKIYGKKNNTEEQLIEFLRK